MRISTSQVYAQVLGNINKSLTRTMELTEQTATQKRIDAPSDDPAGMANTVSLRSYDSALEKYVDNAELASSLLGTADGMLVEASEILNSVMEQAEQGATGTYSDEQCQMMSGNMSAYLDSLLAIANSKSGDDYLFSGEATDTAAYEYVAGVTVTGDSPAETEITAITGELDDPIMVEFTSGGTVGTDALDYRYSLDGGSNWVTGTLAASDTALVLGDVSVELSTGTALTAYDEDAESGSSFVLRNSLAYNGADKAMSVAISGSGEIEVNTVGSDAFGGVDPDTGEAYGEPNLFEAISDAIAYMWIGDEEAVATTLETIRDGYEQVTAVTADVGAREEKADFTSTSLTYARERVASAISSEEDANSAQLSVELSQANYVYEAVLNSASTVMGMSILDYV